MTSLKFGSDSFQFRKRALFKSKNFWDFTDYTSVKNFEISGTQPENTDRRIIFQIDDKLYRFVNSILDEYPYRGEFEDVIKYGNTVGELLNISDIPAFVGKKVFTIIALDAPSTAPVFPKIKIAVKVSSYNDIYTSYEFSPIYQLENNSKIVSVIERKTENGNATATSYCRLKNNSDWSDWIYLSEAQNKICSAIQFKTQFVLTTLDGTDNVENHTITFSYIDDAAKNAAKFRNFYTKTENCGMDLKTCYLLINHSPLENSTLQAFVNLTKSKQRRENLLLGTTAGIEQTLYLPDKFFAQDTLHVELNGVPFFDFYFNTENSALTFTAPAGQNVTASYDYFPAENWQEMTQDFSELQKTRFTFRTLTNNLQDAAVKFKVNGKSDIFSYAAGFSA